HRHCRPRGDRSPPAGPAFLPHPAPAVGPSLTSRAPPATRRPNLFGPPIPRPNHLSARRSLGPTAHPPDRPSARRSTIQRSLDRRPATPVRIRPRPRPHRAATPRRTVTKESPMTSNKQLNPLYGKTVELD